MKSAADITKICHPERSIAIGLFNRNAESRDLLVGVTMDDGVGTMKSAVTGGKC